MTQHSVQDWTARAKALTIRTEAFIDGRFRQAASGATLPCLFPGTGQPVTAVSACDAVDVDRAVASARAAFESGVWSRMAPADRKRIMLRFSELILANRDELGLLETLNVGKPITNSTTGDIPSAATCIAFYAEAIDKVFGEVAPTPHDFTTLVMKEPLGVVAAVVPWNYPLSMTAWKIGPALAAGNSVIVKPAEQSPFTALRVAEIAMEAGIPAGVLNVVPGYGETAGQALGLHMDIDCVTFTGSTEVGKLFLTYSGRSNAKRVSLELGGKSPQIVLADCDDLDAAAQAIAAGIFTNAGQVCNAGSRLVVEESIREKLLEKVVARARQLSPGNPFDPATRLGPLVSEPQMQRVLSYIDAGREAGAEVIAGGSRTMLETGGYFIEPTIFDRVDSRMTIAQEEIFGPVLSTISVRDFDEAIMVANDTVYGLAASVWTSNLKKAHRAVKAIRAGVVWVNAFDRGSMSVPFGGFKQSGFGRDKSLHAIEKYMDLKSVWFAA